MVCHVAAVDCGSSSLKAAVLDDQGRIRAMASRPLACRHSPDGAVSQSPAAIRRACLTCLGEAVRRSALPPAAIAAVAVSNQRATIIPLATNGTPAGDAISWQDMRGNRSLRASVSRRMNPTQFTRITGLPLNPIFTIGKLVALRRRDPQLFRQAARFCLVQDFLLHCLGASEFPCDVSNASLTGLLDLKTRYWHPDLLAAAGIDPARLPSLVESATQVGRLSRRAAAACALLPGTPLISGAGDQQCAALGAGVLGDGVVSITLGTAGVLMAAAHTPPAKPIPGIFCTLHARRGLFCIEGLQPVAMDALLWLVRNVAGRRTIESALRAAAGSPPGARGVMFWPYLCGSGPPRWNAEATASFAGLSRAHGISEMTRALLEGVAFENRAVLDALARHRVPVKRIRLAGGGSSLPLWTRIQADVYARPVQTLRTPQASLLGAAILATLGVGIHKSLPAAVRRMVNPDAICRSHPPTAARYHALYVNHQRIAAKLPHAPGGRRKERTP